MSSRTTVRWGLLSTARINRALIPAIRLSTRSELVAVASREASRAQAYAAEWQIPRAHGSYEALLADPDIEAVYNSLPNSLHPEWTIRAARAGKHVLCEKPLALSLADVDAMAAAAAEAGVVLTEAFMYRHHPQTLEVKAQVDAGAIGTLQLVQGAFTFQVRQPTNIRFDPLLGGGSLWDVGCYPVSWARTVIGREPVEVFGMARMGRTGVDETFVGEMRFPGDVLAQFDSGLAAPFRTSIELVGSEGTIRVDQPFKPPPRASFVVRRGDEERHVTAPEQALYLGEVEDIVDAILLGHPPRISLDDSRRNIVVILALLRSARESKPVALVTPPGPD